MNFSGMLKRYRGAFPLQALNELLHEEEILDAEIGGCGAVSPSGLPFSQPGFSFSHMQAHLHCQDGLENCRIFSRVLITHVARLAAKAPTIANASWLLRYVWGAHSRVQVFVLSVRLRTEIREYCTHWTCWTYCPSCSCRPVRIEKIFLAQKTGIPMLVKPLRCEKKSPYLQGCAMPFFCALHALPTETKLLYSQT